MIKKIVIVAMLAASFGSIATPAVAARVIQVAPPPPREEPAPSRAIVMCGLPGTGNGDMATTNG